MSRDEILSSLEVLMGGRAAEELVFDEITSGASNDIERATQMARSFVCTYGMSKSLGTRKYGGNQEQVFLGKSYGSDSKDYSDDTATLIDNEIKALIDMAYDNSMKILTKNRKKLDEIAKLLLEKETIGRDEFLELLKTKKQSVRKRISKVVKDVVPKKSDSEPPIGLAPASSPA